MQELTGRVAVVTGAASGIGLAVVEAFAAAGMRLAMGDLNEAALAEHADRLRARGHEVLALPTDVRDPAALEALAEATVARFGGLHIAVNNAGIVNRGLTWELPLEEWHRVLDINLWGVIHGIHAFVPRILATGEEGHVVNTASMAAVHAVGQLGPYTAAKHAVLGISDVLRMDLEAEGAPVGVSVVFPGMVRTGMNPIGSLGPETVAANVVDAIRTGRAYVYTDDHHRAAVEQRLHALIEARDQVV
jgi:NAD(P)-dependent dehydrogenase (short-subunit alcohol dehydrogenase family)